MAIHVKGSAILLLAAFVCGVSGQVASGGNGNQAAGGGGGGAAVGGSLNRQRPVGEPVPINVAVPASYGIPIQFTAQDYNGPYDPSDPKGTHAAARRQESMTNKKNMEMAKSYIPPGLGNVVKKEVVKVALDEGRRFAVSHPRETAEIAAIAAKGKALVDNAARQLKKAEN